MVALFIISSILDIVGISLIALFIKIILAFDQFILQTKNQITFFEKINNLEFQIVISFSLLMFYLLKFLLVFNINRKVINYCHTTQFLLASKLYNNMLNIDIKLRKEDTAANYVQSIQILTDSFSKQVLLPIFRILSDGLIVLSLAIFLAFQNFLAFTFILLLTVSLGYIYDKSVRGLQREQGAISNDSRQKIIRNIVESFTGLLEIRIFGRELFFREKIKVELNRFRDSSALGLILATSPKFAVELVLMCYLLGVLILLNATENTHVEMLSIFGVYAFAAMRIVPLSNSILSSISELRLRADTVDRLYSELNSISNSEYDVSIGNTHNVNSKDEFSSLEFKSVSFHYPGENRILDNVNLKILRGELVALLGESGSGKSTFMSIIMGLLQPTSGKILINSQDVDVKKYFTDLCSYAPQVPFAIEGSVFENISLNNYQKIKHQKAEESLISSGFAKEVDERLLQYLISSGGSNLSGGQLQRLALARALFFDREILLLDEMTSSLDEDTEKAVFENIKRLKGQKTIVIATHNTKEIKDFDKVFIFKDGKVTQR